MATPNAKLAPMARTYDFLWVFAGSVAIVDFLVRPLWTVPDSNGVLLGDDESAGATFNGWT